MIKSIVKKETYLPYILALLLPIINFIVNFKRQSDFDITVEIFHWIFLTIMLLFIWFINLRIQNLSTLKIFALNLFFVGSATFFESSIFNNVEFTPAFIRLLMPSFLFIVLQHSFRSIRQSEKLKRENLLLKAENYKAELENLKKQLDPHFLFNSLTTLLTVIRKDTEIAEKYVTNLSDIYRKILNNSSIDKISLQDEVEFITSYLFLQKTRFEKALIFDIVINENSMFYNLPSFALQLLVENCIKHNIVSEEKPLNIKIFQIDETTITVENNFQPKKNGEKSGGLGIENLKKRYNLLGIAEGVEIKNDKTNFTVTLKLF